MTSFPRLKILLVEDDRADFILTRELLRQIDAQSFDLHWVQSLSQAREWAQANGEPDLYLLDYRLDHEVSLDFLREKQAQRAPILMLTGQQEKEIDDEALQAGAADYLVKGQVTPDQLSRAIRYSLDRQATRLALLRARDELEEKVRECTRELNQMNERLRTTNRLKDEFLATLSHELRSPLNVIGGHAELLMSESLRPDELQSSLEAIRRNVRHQTQMVDDLLDVSRIITGKMSLQTSSIRLSKVLTEAMDSVRFAAEARSVHFLIENESSDVWMIGDLPRLRQMLWNLFSNAVKFSPKGGTVRVSWQEDGGEIEVSVRDQGEGIGPEFLPFIFDRFRQEDSSMTRRHGGLGLGLAIVRHIAELHGGGVSAESAGRGRGATFRVRLPLSGQKTETKDGKLDPASEGPAGPAVHEAGLRLRGRNLLLVDDHQDTLRILSRFVKFEDVQVRTASSVSEALGRVQEQRPDLIITDISMPGEDGFVLMEKLQTTGLEIPCIALTAHAGAAVEKDIRSAGFVRHLTKPIFRDQLLTAILETL